MKVNNIFNFFRSNSRTPHAPLPPQNNLLNEETQAIKNESLCKAVKDGDFEAVKSSLEAGADIETKSTKASTPLILASYNGSTDIIKLLLEAGANKEAKDNENWNPLLITTFKGHTESVELLLNYWRNSAN